MDRIQLIVNRVQVTKHSDVNKLQLYIYPISVNRLSPLNIRIGKVSFSQSFCLSYRCNVLLTFILEVMKNSGFTVPQLDYRLTVNGQSVDMKERLEDVGCVENSEIVVEAGNGDSLEDVFCVGNPSDSGATEKRSAERPDAASAPSVAKQSREYPKEKAIESGVKRSVVEAEQSAKSVMEQPAAKSEARPSSEPMKEAGSSSEPLMNPRQSSGPASEARQSSEPVQETTQDPIDDAFVSSRQSKQRRVTESSAEEAQSPMKEESRQMEIPSSVKAALKEMAAGLAEDSDEYRRVAALQEFAEGSTRQLSDMYAEYLRMKELVDQIHYENQMLREMVNEAMSSPEAASEREKAERLSWRRVSSDRASGESLSKELPEDPEALKKLVNEKYATALMNERRYLKEKKRCQKYRLIAEAAGMGEKSVDEVYVQLHEVLEHRDQLKESNLNLKEAERALQQEIDARDDEIHRLRLTVQARDESIAQLADQIKEYDELLRENASKEDATLPVEVKKSVTDDCSHESNQPVSEVVKSVGECGEGAARGQETAMAHEEASHKESETSHDKESDTRCDNEGEIVNERETTAPKSPSTEAQSLQECEAKWRDRVASLEKELQEVREQLGKDMSTERKKLEEECASLKRENEYLTSELREMIGGEEEEESVMTQLSGLIQVLMEKQTMRKERASTIFGNDI